MWCCAIVLERFFILFFWKMLCINLCKGLYTVLTCNGEDISCRLSKHSPIVGVNCIFVHQNPCTVLYILMVLHLTFAAGICRALHRGLSQTGEPQLRRIALVKLSKYCSACTTALHELCVCRSCNEVCSGSLCYFDGTMFTKYQMHKFNIFGSIF